MASSAQFVQMIIGQTLMASTSTKKFYSGWFSRQGNAATMVVEILHNVTAGIEVRVQTKNSEDADGAASYATGSAITATSNAAPVSGRFTGFKELVRFEYAVTDTSGWVHFRVLNPSWETN